MTELDPPLLETGYYYPEPYWHEGDGSWLKSLLLFFDRIAILLPEYMYGRHQLADPVVAGALEEMGLLLVLRPEEFVDQELTEALVRTVRALLDTGVFDDLPEAGYFAELSRSRMGWNADVELSADLIDELKARNLARDTEDGVSIPLHPQVRTTILVLLSQLARGAGRKSGLDLYPITQDRARLDDLVKTLSLGIGPSAGQIVTLDLETVGFNLEGIALEDVLEFRAQHLDQHRVYARSVRRAIAELGAVVDGGERARLLEDRRDELLEQAEALRRTARSRWRMPLARFSLGAAGATANAVSGNVPGVVMSALGALLGARPGPGPDSVYSYLFTAERRLRP